MLSVELTDGANSAGENAPHCDDSRRGNVSLQVDPEVSDTWSAYGYASHNPVLRKDPEGRDEFDEIDGMCKRFVGFLICCRYDGQEPTFEDCDAPGFVEDVGDWIGGAVTDVGDCLLFAECGGGEGNTVGCSGPGCPPPMGKPGYGRPASCFEIPSGDHFDFDDFGDEDDPPILDPRCWASGDSDIEMLDVLGD